MTTAKARARFLARCEDEVDPNRELPEAERVRRAEHARKAYFTRLAFESAQGTTQLWRSRRCDVAIIVGV